MNNYVMLLYVFVVKYKNDELQRANYELQRILIGCGHV